jgi:hypothetical protein
MTQGLALERDQGQARTEPQPRRCSRGWAARCARARSTRCTCACGGHNHGADHGTPAARSQQDTQHDPSHGGQLSMALNDTRRGGTRRLTDHKLLDYSFGETPQRQLLPGAGPHDPRAIVCTRLERGEARVELDTANYRVPLAQPLVRHSPTGYEWGYHGSGPGDLALNVLALVVPPKEANRLHQDFKRDAVATISQDAGGRIALADVAAWVQARWALEQADPKLMADEVEQQKLAADIAAADAAADAEGAA